jgi:hypothetical protein
MKRIAFGLVALGAIVGFSNAGLKGGYPVAIYPDVRMATGGMGYARNDGVGNMHIGCEIHGQPGALPYAKCEANNGAGLSASCISRDQFLTDHLKGLNSDSRITFDWDTEGNCIRIIIRTTSVAEPKEP